MAEKTLGQVARDKWRDELALSEHTPNESWQAVADAVVAARAEAAEALVAGLRGALELLLKCNALGVVIPWGKAVSALTEADRLEKESANAEYLGGTNGK